MCNCPYQPAFGCNCGCSKDPGACSCTCQYRPIKPKEAKIGFRLGQAGKSIALSVGITVVISFVLWPLLGPIAMVVGLIIWPVIGALRKANAGQGNKQ